MVDSVKPEEEALHVLDSVWRQFGSKSIVRLNATVKNHPPIVEAWENGLGTEITFDAMVIFYMKILGQHRPKPSQDEALADAPSPDRVLRPKLMKSPTGKPVAVNRWNRRRVDK